MVKKYPFLDSPIPFRKASGSLLQVTNDRASAAFVEDLGTGNAAIYYPIGSANRVVAPRESGLYTVGSICPVLLGTDGRITRIFPPEVLDATAEGGIVAGGATGEALWQTIEDTGRLEEDLELAKADVAAGRAEAAAKFDETKTLADKGITDAADAFNLAAMAFKNGENRVYNPSFERDFDGWGHLGAAWSIGATAPADGVKLAHAVSTNPASSAILYTSAEKYVSVAPDSVWQVRVRVRLDAAIPVSGASISVSLIIKTASGTGSRNIAVLKSGDTAPVGSWITLTGLATIFAGGISAAPQILFVGFPVGAAIDFDFVELRDFTAVAKAQATGDAAALVAASATASAAAAQATATTSLTTANGKNKITYSTAAPVGIAPANDVWWRSAAGIIIGQWVSDGATWVPTVIDNQMIANLDVGKLTAGQANISQAVIDKLWVDVIRARKITTDMLLISAPDNLIPNGMRELGNATGWPSPIGYSNTKPVDGPPGTLYVAASTGNVSLPSTSGAGEYLPVNTGEEYLFEFWCRATVANTKMYVEFRDQASVLLPGWVSVEGTAAGTNYPVQGLPVPTAFTKVSAKIIIPAGVTSIRMSTLYFNHSSGTAFTAAYYFAMRLRSRTSGLLIADTIIGKTITGGEITHEGTYGTSSLKTSGDYSGLFLVAANGSTGQLITNDFGAYLSLIKGTSQTSMHAGATVMNDYTGSMQIGSQGSNGLGLVIVKESTDILKIDPTGGFSHASTATGRGTVTVSPPSTTNHTGGLRITTAAGSLAAVVEAGRLMINQGANTAPTTAGLWITGIGSTTTAANVVIGADGRFAKFTSLRAAKAKIRDIDGRGNAILDLPVRTWLDREQIVERGRIIEENALHEAAGQFDQVVPVPVLRRIPGVIAEEVQELGLDEFLTWDENDQLQGVATAHVPLLLIPVVKEHEHRITELENENRALKEILEALTARVKALENKNKEII